MEIKKIENWADKLLLVEKLTRCQKQIDSIIENFSGEKKNYLDHGRELLDKLAARLETSNPQNTSSKVFKNVSIALESLGVSLGVVDGSVNFPELQNNFDSILELLPLLETTNDKNSKLHEREEVVDRAFQAFGDKLNTKAQEVDTLAKQSIEEITTKQALIEAKAEEKFERIDFLVSQAEKHSHVLSGKVLSNKFSDEADKHRNGKRIWTGVTAVLVVFTLVWLGLAIYSLFVPGTIDIPETMLIPILVAKGLLTLTLGLITRWTSKRATHHLAEETRYRRLAVNLDTLHSFVAPLESVEQNKVIGFVAAKILSDYPAENIDGHFDSPTIGDLINSLANKPGDRLPRVDLH